MADRAGIGIARSVLLSVLLSFGALHFARTEPVIPRAASNDSTCRRSAFRVVIDVGHTVDKPGAMSARGVSEYEFNLRLAKQIVEKLIDAGFDKTVLLITADPPRRGLFERAARANTLRVDLFLSIHHDAVPDSFLEKWEYEGKENHFSDRFKGHSIFISHDNRELGQSLAFAKLLGDRLKAQGLQYTPHYTQKIMGRWRHELVDREAGVYRYDQLVVLRKTRMPAVLLEAGSIVNRDEELLLAGPDRQSSISAAVADAVESFCASRASRSPGRLTPARGTLHRTDDAVAAMKTREALCEPK
jgi:N-acetylmuramoyl-L-alanine amidase